ncbi:MAG: tetratricopeptide repeat protein [Opitutaceae bacterium]
MSSFPFPKFLRTTGPAILLALVTLAVFSNTFRAPFVLDDTSSIKNNLSIRRLWPIESSSIGGTRGRPVANVSFALNYRMSGLDPGSYHWTNLVIHVAAGLFLFGVIRRTLRLPIAQGRFSELAVDGIAFGGALLWLIHPLQTEAVTYVVQRTESLMGLHYLATVYCFARAVQSPMHRLAWQAFAVVACFAGMACKEVMVTAPVAVLLYDRTFVAGTFRKAWRERGRVHLAFASSWIALAWLMSGLGDRGVGFANNVTPWEYALTESCVLLRYLKLSLWPAPLVFDYGADLSPSLADVWPCALLVLMGIIGVFVALRFRPVVGFLLAWPFLTLAPTSSFVPVALQPMAEHRMYLPLAGVVLLIVIGAYRYLGVKAWIMVVALACGLGTTAFRRNAVYADEILLWQDTAEKRPGNARAHQNLGTVLLNAGQFPEAQRELERTLAIAPENFQALNNLGIIYARTGRAALAIATFEEVLRTTPGFAEAHYNLGCLMLEQGRTREAALCFEKAIQLSPKYGAAHVNLAATLLAEQKFREATEHYTAALEVLPGDANLYLRRAYAYIQIGRTSEAMADYASALKLQPDLAEARHNLEVLRRASAR